MKHILGLYSNEVFRTRNKNCEQFYQENYLIYKKIFSYTHKILEKKTPYLSFKALRFNKQVKELNFIKNNLLSMNFGDLLNNHIKLSQAIFSKIEKIHIFFNDWEKMDSFL